MRCFSVNEYQTRLARSENLNLSKRKRSAAEAEQCLKDNGPQLSNADKSVDAFRVHASPSYETPFCANIKTKITRLRHAQETNNGVATTFKRPRKYRSNTT